MSKDFLADIPTDGEAFGEDTEKETPSDSPTEDNQEETTPDQGEEVSEETTEEATEETEETDNTGSEKNVPFHEHPRWQEREKELKELRSFKEEAQSKLQKLDEFDKKISASDPEIPEWFTELYGDDPKVWKRYQEGQKSLIEQAKQEIKAEQESERQKVEEEKTQWMTWANSEMDSLTSTGKLKQGDRNELVKTMLKYRPTDEEGNLSFSAGVELMELQQAQKNATTKEKTEIKKKIASITTDKSKGDVPEKDYVSNNDLRGRGWSSLL